MFNIRKEKENYVPTPAKTKENFDQNKKIN